MATALGGVKRGSETDFGDSRERLLDSDTGSIKSSYHGGDRDLAMTSEVYYHDQRQANGTYHFKILVPSIAAGAIIGKKGETIAQLQKDVGVKVKMSKATDFYPGTKERVCLISGSVEGILTLHEFIMEKIKERPDPHARMAIDFDHKQPAEREKQVKILVPNNTAGIIIGKSGCYIKHIKEESGAYVQISQKYKDPVLAERCITVIGEMENNKIACHMILEKIVEDRQSGSCLNVSYADVNRPVANFNPTGSPFANSDSVVPSDAMNDSYSSYSSNGSLNSLSPSSTQNFNSPQTVATHSRVVPFTGVGMGGFAIPPNNVAEVIQTVKTMLRGNDYSEQAVSEICAAVNTLANYGMLGLNLGILNRINGAPVVSGLEIGIPNSATTSYPVPPGGMANQCVYTSATEVTQVETSNSAAASDPSEAGYNMFGRTDLIRNEMPGLDLGSAFTPSTNFRSNDRFLVQAEEAVFESFHRSSPVLASPSAGALHVNNSSFKFGTELNSGPPSLRKNSTLSDRQMCDIIKIEIEVGENIVGAILGPEGKSLLDIQRLSGANIQISKKGVFALGTRNRIVTITGFSNAVNIAQHLIEQQISEEEAKRAQQNVMRALR